MWKWPCFILLPVNLLESDFCSKRFRTNAGFKKRQWMSPLSCVKWQRWITLNTSYFCPGWMSVLQSKAGLSCGLPVSSLWTGLSPDLQSMEQIRRIMRPTDVPDQGLLCDLLWSDPDKDVLGWGENDRGVSFTFGAEVVAKFLHKHDLDLICRAHQVFSFCTLHHRII